MAHDIATRVVPSPMPSTDSSNMNANARTGTAAEIAECAKIMLGAFRLAEADDPEIYVGHIRRVLSKYPLWVAKKAAERVPDEFKWLPSLSEVREVCDHIYGPQLRHADRQKRIEEQLAARALQVPKARQTCEEFCWEMKERRMLVRKQDRPMPGIDVEAFKRAYGVTEEMWDQLPNNDCKFKKLC